MTDYLYRVQILDQPEWEERLCFDRRYNSDLEEWETHHDYFPCPVGWEPSDWYVGKFKTDKWIEPALDKSWRSRSSAALRRDILVEAGYRATIQRSAPIEWPAPGKKSVPESEVHQVKEAIRTLKRAGLIKSADDLI